MEDLLSLVELAAYVAGVLAASAAITWLVVKISPSEAAKQQKRQEEARQANGPSG